MYILGIESSCDETAASVCERCADTKLRVRSNIVASQIEIHKRYGGVVPEIASRAHTEAISRLVYDALDEARVAIDDISAIAVTNTPGLIGALLVGVNFAKALAYSRSIPLIGVDHIMAHAAANYVVPALPGMTPEQIIDAEARYIKPQMPALVLIASGGHTSIINARSYTDFETIGRTRDDAMGEAFDKIARVIGLPYPGGAELDRLAAEFFASGEKLSIKPPSAAIAGDNLDFSFSGLKTYMINYIHTSRQRGIEPEHAMIAASLTNDVISSVLKKLSSALELTGALRLIAAGGVTANSHLRTALVNFAFARGIELYLPPRSLCGDNGVMAAAQGFCEYDAGHFAPPTLNGIASGAGDGGRGYAAF